MIRNAAAPKTTTTTAAIIPPIIPPEDEPPLVDGCEEEDAEGKELVMLLDPVGNADVPLPIIDVGCVSKLFAVEVDLCSLAVSLAVDADLWVLLVAAALVVAFDSVVGFDFVFVVAVSSFLVVPKEGHHLLLTHVS